MEFSLTIDCVNDAFMASPEAEIARILRAAADKLEQHPAATFVLRDLNGNRVGHAQLVTGV